MRYLIKPAFVMFISWLGLAIHSHGSITTPGFCAADTGRVVKSGNSVSGNTFFQKGEIKKEICSINESEISNKKIVKKAVLKGEISGISTFYLKIPDGSSYVYKPGKRSVSVFLVTHGKGLIKQGNRQFEVDNVNLFVPSVLKKASIKAGNGSLGILEITIMLNEKEFDSVRLQTGKLPYFVDYTKCTEYKESIKSPKTISRTILPENIIPRFCLGSVETTGPDTVGAHAHPMLEQLFFGLAHNDCIVKADEAATTFKENTLLHIPLGSTHGVTVEEGKVLYYIWMDLFRSQEDMSYIRENHITKEK